MLRVVKSDPNLKHQSCDLQDIRKTAKGFLVLQLSRASAAALYEAVGKALGDRAVVKTLKEFSQIEIRDLDELASKKEILEAIRVQLKDSSLPI
ncbi:hypothetical protein AWZ03_015100, partial [Drosophila navojoa]